MNANVMSITVVIPSMLCTASMNTTAAVATPFGAFRDMYSFSYSVYSFRLACVARNLIAVCAVNSIADVMKNSLVYGMSIISPVSMKTSI